MILLLWRVCYHSRYALEINSPLDCLIYGQIYIENVSGGSMHGVTESTPHQDHRDLCSNPGSCTCGTLCLTSLGFNEEWVGNNTCPAYQTEWCHTKRNS